MKAINRKLLRDLRAMWSQALTIALVLACGVGGFIASYSAYESLAWARDVYYADARFADVFSSLKRAPLALGRRLQAIPGVGEVQLSIAHDVPVTLMGTPDPIVGRLVGIDERVPQRLNRLSVRRGRMVEATAGGVLETLVSEGFAAARRLGPGDEVQALINGKRERLRIVGIAVSPEYVFAGFGGTPDQRSFGVFWVRNEALGAAYDMQGAFNRVAIRLSPDASEPAVIDALNRYLTPYGGADAHGRDVHPSDQALSQEIREQRVLGSILPSIFLAVAAFLLNVVLTRQIAMQRGQIATLKALGYGNARIALHYLQSVGLIALAGLVLGVTIGALLGKGFVDLYGEFFHLPTLRHRVAPPLLVAAAGAAAVAALAGTFYAVRACVRLTPAEAMQPPAPSVYRPALVERVGLSARFSPGWRMVMRTMERRLLRTSLTIGGIAISLAIIVAGTFWRDAVDYLIDTEFGLVLRGNVDVTLIDAVPAGVRHELARLPGVRRVEVKRNVAVRFENGNRSYRGVVQGMEPQPQLLRIVDAGHRAHEPPVDGILLTDRLASRLGAKVGDQIRLQVLEGRREVLTVRVQGTARELMGLNGYMDRRNLNRLLRESDQINRATLAVDPEREAELLERIKAIPRIAAALSRQTFLRNLQDVTARNVLIFSTILTAFASIIAVGVVYNHARIALAERAWELASLRVLGFTRGEASGFLLGELVSEIALALPLGMLLGYGLSMTIVNSIMSDQVYFPLVIRPRTYAFAAVCVVLAGIASALIVRRHVDRLDLVAVLKTRE